MEKEDIRTYSMEDIKRMRDSGLSQTRADAPEYEIDPSFWENAKIVMPKAKKSIHLKLDEEIFEWFKNQGAGHITRMQAILKSYYEAHL